MGRKTISDKDIPQVKALYQGGYKVVVIAKMFGATHAGIIYLAKKNGWERKSVDPESCDHKHYIVRCSHCGKILGSEVTHQLR